MKGKRKNYYKKPVSSVAVLSYFAVIPFYNNAARVSSLLKYSPTPETDIEWAIEQACKEIQASFMSEDKIFDDGVVEVVAVIEDSHVLLYMKLPATLSAHSGISQIRMIASKYLRCNALSKYMDIYSTLFSSTYLVFSAPYDSEHVTGPTAGVYSSLLHSFYLENDLKGDRQNFHNMRKQLFGRKNVLSDRVTLYN